MLKFVFLFASFIAISVQQTAPDRVPVDVYYESLCPDSINFVVDQLAPIYNTSLRDHLNLTLVPYGKTNYSKIGNGYDFSCHHGPVECYGNKVHGCIVKNVPGVEDQLNYITCLARQAKNVRNQIPVEECVMGEHLTVTTNCANNTEGDEILATNGEETAKLEPKLKSVPLVVLNKKQNKTEQDWALNEFKKLICSHLENKNLDDCKAPNPSSAPSISLSFAAMLSFILFRFL